MLDLTPVVIVGGGPVGAGLAIELGQRGVRCVLVEPHSAPQPIPKGQNLTQRTVEHFHFWGVQEQIARARIIPREFGSGGLTTYGTLLSGYAYSWHQREKVRPYYFTDNDRLPQYQTEKVLRRRIEELPSVETYYGWRAESVQQNDNNVSVTITRSEDAAPRTLTAQFAVGCDGSRSMVREHAGIQQTRDEHDRKMVLLLFRSKPLNRLLERYPGKFYFNVLHPMLDGYWQFFGRVDFDGTFFFHAPVPADTTADNYDFARLLHDAVGATFAIEFDYVGFWDLRIAAAKTYRQGRLFIAGDAAHSHPPYGGFGINTGFEDARNLGWKIAATLDGWAGPRLLDSYSDERQPVFVSTGQHFIARVIAQDREFVRNYDPTKDLATFEVEWNRRGSGADEDVFGFEPNYEGSPVVCGPPGGVCSAKGKHTFAARAGHHLAPRRLSSGNDVYEALGPEFTLIALEAESAAKAFESAASNLGIPLEVIRDSPADGRDAWEASVILVRPDHFVAHAGNRLPPADAEAVLATAAGLEIGNA